MACLVNVVARRVACRLGATLLLLLAQACADGESAPAATTAPVCNADAYTLGGIDQPIPIVSIAARVTASDGVTTPEKAVDGLYHAGHGAGLGVPTPDAPAWIAIELEPGPTRLLLTWADASFGDYTSAGAAPLDYSLETSADSSDGSDGEWTEVANVPLNPVRTRAHAFDFADQRWVRMTVRAAPADVPVELDELALHNLSSVSGRPADSWFFLGDSITAGAFQRNSGPLVNFDGRIHKERPDYTPAVIGGGIGGEFSTDGRARLQQVLDLNPDATYVGVGYGTNDSWGNKHLEVTSFEEAMSDIVATLIADGRVPVLARIPYASVNHTTLPEFNAVIDRLTKDNGLPCGPDLFSYFKAHPDELSSDGVHPSSAGYQSMNGEWAKAALALYPAP